MIAGPTDGGSPAALLGRSGATTLCALEDVTLFRDVQFWVTDFASANTSSRLEGGLAVAKEEKETPGVSTENDGVSSARSAWAKVPISHDCSSMLDSWERMVSTCEEERFCEYVNGRHASSDSGSTKACMASGRS